MFRTFVFLLSLTTATQAATLVVSPANPTAAPGGVVQLGFTITNTTDFLLVTGSGYCQGSPTLPVCPASAVATYTDIIGTNFILVGPSPESTSVSEPGGATTGLGHLNFLANATGSEAGLFYISYELYSRSPNDPLFDSITDTVAVGEFLTAATTLTIDTAIPEPATFTLSGLTLTAIAAAGLRRRS